MRASSEAFIRRGNTGTERNEFRMGGIDWDFSWTLQWCGSLQHATCSEEGGALCISSVSWIFFLFLVKHLAFNKQTTSPSQGARKGGAHEVHWTSYITVYFSVKYSTNGSPTPSTYWCTVRFSGIKEKGRTVSVVSAVGIQANCKVYQEAFDANGPSFVGQDLMQLLQLK